MEMIHPAYLFTVHTYRNIFCPNEEAPNTPVTGQWLKSRGFLKRPAVKNTVPHAENHVTKYHVTW